MLNTPLSSCAFVIVRITKGFQAEITVRGHHDYKDNLWKASTGDERSCQKEIGSHFATDGHSVFWFAFFDVGMTDSYLTAKIANREA